MSDPRVTVGCQRDGLTMLHIDQFPVGAHIYNLKASALRALIADLTVEAERQESEAQRMRVAA